MRTYNFTSLSANKSFSVFCRVHLQGIPLGASSCLSLFRARARALFCLPLKFEPVKHVVNPRGLSEIRGHSSRSPRGERSQRRLFHVGGSDKRGSLSRTALGCVPTPIVPSLSRLVDKRSTWCACFPDQNGRAVFPCSTSSGAGGSTNNARVVRERFETKERERGHRGRIK